MGLVISDSWAVRNQASLGETMPMGGSGHMALLWVQASQEWSGRPGCPFSDGLKQHRESRGTVNEIVAHIPHVYPSYICS